MIITNPRADDQQYVFRLQRLLMELEIESCNLCRIIIISNTTIKIINKNVRIMISNTSPDFKQNFHSKSSFSFCWESLYFDWFGMKLNFPKSEDKKECLSVLCPDVPGNQCHVLCLLICSWFKSCSNYFPCWRCERWPDLSHRSWRRTMAAGGGEGTGGRWGWGDNHWTLDWTGLDW